MEKSDCGKHAASKPHVINLLDLEIKQQYFQKLQEMKGKAKCPLVIFKLVNNDT